MGNKIFKSRRKKKEEKERIKNVNYGRKVVPANSGYRNRPRSIDPPSTSYNTSSYNTSTFNSTELSSTTDPIFTEDIDYNEISYRDISRHPERYGYKSVVTIDVDVDTPQGAKSYHYEIDEDKFVKMTIDYLLANRLDDASYLIGYKMVYMVDSKRRKIPGVIAIVTLRIPRHKNSIYQSEGKHKQKDVYKMIKFQDKRGPGKYYDRDSQARSLPSRSLRHSNQKVDGNGDMVAWEHSTKYCAYKVETIGITILGRLKNVVVASHLYNQNLACAESAFTLEENQTPVVYEVGKSNISKHKRPSAGIGSCLDFFHFFLHPQYAIDYGFYNFLLDENQNAIDLKTITVSKKFDKLRKASVFKENDSAEDFIRHDKRNRDRSTAEFVRTAHGYRTKQYVMDDERNRKAVDAEARRIDRELEDELRYLEDELNDSSSYYSYSDESSISSKSSESNSTSSVSENNESITMTIPDPITSVIRTPTTGLRRRRVRPRAQYPGSTRAPGPVKIAWPEVPKHKIGKAKDSDTESESESESDSDSISSDVRERRVANYA